MQTLTLHKLKEGPSSQVKFKLKTGAFKLSLSFSELKEGPNQPSQVQAKDIFEVNFKPEAKPQAGKPSVSLDGLMMMIMMMMVRPYHDSPSISQPRLALTTPVRQKIP